MDPPPSLILEHSNISIYTRDTVKGTWSFRVVHGGTKLVEHVGYGEKIFRHLRRRRNTLIDLNFATMVQKQDLTSFLDGMEGVSLTIIESPQP